MVRRKRKNEQREKEKSAINGSSLRGLSGNKIYKNKKGDQKEVWIGRHESCAHVAHAMWIGVEVQSVMSGGNQMTWDLIFSHKQPPPDIIILFWQIKKIKYYSFFFDQEY